jgi:anthranilate/para-aminobenzoate synthase component II
MTNAIAGGGTFFTFPALTWPLEGVQYRPESFLTEQGEKPLGNFLKK